MSERLPRLPQGMGLFTQSGKPTQAMQRFWERLCEEIESSRSRMDDIPDLTIAADYAGTVSPADQLPENVLCKRYFQEVDVTASSAWTVEVQTGSVTCTIGASTGVLNITAVGSAESLLKVTSVRGGLTLYKTFTVYRSDSAPPSTGGGGSGAAGSASDTSFSSISSTTYAAISDELEVTTGSGGSVALSAPLSVRTAAASPDGVFEVQGVWRWWDGAAYVDVAGSEAASNPDSTVVEDAETGALMNKPHGTLNVSGTKSGLGASTAAKFQLYAKNTSGTRTMTFTGTASAVAS